MKFIFSPILLLFENILLHRSCCTLEEGVFVLSVTKRKGFLSTNETEHGDRERDGSKMTVLAWRNY